jgi:hypothetical protein
LEETEFRLRRKFSPDCDAGDNAAGAKEERSAGLIASIFIETHLERMLSPVDFTLAPASIIFERRDAQRLSVWFGAAGLAGRI